MTPGEEHHDDRSRPPRNGASAEVEHLSVEQRVALGKAARARTPRSSHAEFEPAADRPDPIDLLERQAESARARAGADPLRPHGRVAVHLLPRRRAAAWPPTSRTRPRRGCSVQLCGDAHLSNFGVFASPERRLVFDINDFDETLPGPWEWDVKRLAASLVGRRPRQRLLRRPTRSDRAQRGRRLPRDDARVRRQDQPRRLVRAPRRRGPDVARCGSWRRRRCSSAPRRRSPRPRTKDSMQAFKKLTQVVDGEPRIVGDPPLIEPIDQIFPGHPPRPDLRGAAQDPAAATARRCSTTAGSCSRSSGWSTWPARWSASAASAPAPGSRCCSAATATTRCSCS